MVSLREKVVRDLEERGLIDRNQITQANITMFTAANEGNSYSVCELTLQGIGAGPQADSVTITAEIEGEIVKSVDVPIVSGDCRVFVVTLPVKKITKYAGQTKECTVLVQDTYFRTLAVSSDMVLFDVLAKENRASADVRFVPDVDCSKGDTLVKIADVSFKSDLNVPFGVDVYRSNTLIWHDTIHVTTGNVCERPVSVMPSLLNGSDKADIRMVVKCQGNVIAEKASVLKVKLPEKSGGPPQKKAKDSPKETGTGNGPIAEIPMVDGDLNMLAFVDVHNTSSGSVNIGEMQISNRERDAVDLFVALTVDGYDIFSSVDNFSPGKKKIRIDVPFSKIAYEDAHNIEVVLAVCDKHGRKVSCRSATVPVKSKYDLDLCKLKSRIPLYVNPRDKVISGFLQDTNGPLAKAMGGHYKIIGYQQNGCDVRRQMEGAFKMLRDSNIRYVSDIFVIDKNGPGYCYQRIKSPSKTFESRNGNCIEMSLLFASIFEAMGLEPVILLPPGHAMVGVVMSTNEYESSADVADKYLKEFNHRIEYGCGGKNSVIVAIESTLCAYNGVSFEEAAESAVNTIIECNKKKETVDFVFISKARSVDHIYPIPEL